MLQHAIRAIEEQFQVNESKTPRFEALEYLPFRSIPWVVYFTNKQGLGEAINSVYSRYMAAIENTGIAVLSYAMAVKTLRRVQDEIELLKKQEALK